MLGKFFGSVVEKAQKLGGLAAPVSAPIPKPPQWLRLPSLHSFNFILIHYMYMIGMTLLVSILVYPAGGLRYIDALFFSAGAATQSGLNTVDFNQLKLYQQIVLVITACLCNPIIINAFVVFVRLYWFEKRFQGVVTQARTFRGRTISKRRSQEKENPNFDSEERGVGGRKISVLHNGSSNEKAPLGGDEDNVNFRSTDEQNGNTIESAPSSGHALPPSGSPTERIPEVPFHRDIVFADELATKTPTKEISDDGRIPGDIPKEQHIAFIENQRNPKDKSALWIPGPRDVERGYKPQRVEEGDSSSDDEERDRRHSIGHLGRTFGTDELNGDDHPMPKEPTTMEERLRTGLRKLRRRSNSTDKPEDEPSGTARPRQRLGPPTRSFTRPFSQDRREIEPLPYLSYAATIGRNSTFVDLTEEQREELGGIEYRSLKTLAWVLIAYYWGFFLFSYVILVPWIARSKNYSKVVTEAGEDPIWWGFFTSMSFFTDLGFTLTPDSMISFQRAVLPLLLGTFLIIIGNTGFPCMLRFCIWLTSKFVPYGGGVWEELRFLLDHPRRCFTLLFPKRATWWLFGVLIILNGLDLIFFVLLDIHDETVTSLPGGIQFLDGLFQAASTRTAGFACVNLADLHPGIQVSYLIMMYISVFPIAISVRQTNVYEEKSLGIYASAEEDEESDPNSTSYLGSHLRRQLSFDLWYVFLGLFLITIIEGHRIENVNEPAFTIFSILFEIVSAYGTVGLSLGYPNVNASFSSQFRTLSKLIIIAMMLRGRHRGLPYALDRAILLPSESLQRKEAAMDGQRRERRMSSASLRVGDASGSQVGPRIGEITTHTNASRRTSSQELSRSRSRHGLKRIVTAALNAGPTVKHPTHSKHA